MPQFVISLKCGNLYVNDVRTCICFMYMDNYYDKVLFVVPNTNLWLCLCLRLGAGPTVPTPLWNNSSELKIKWQEWHLMNIHTTLNIIITTLCHMNINKVLHSSVNLVKDDKTYKTIHVLQNYVWCPFRF